MRTLFEISKSGLRTAERSLAVTSNNIINADAPGYSRQRVDKNAVGMQKTGYHAGLGVNITSVNRLRNEMNDLLLNEKRQNMSFLREQAKIFEQLETTVASDSGGDLDMRIGRLFDAFSELSADPQDLSVRNQLMSEADQLTTKLSDMSRGINQTQDLVRDSATISVQSVNQILRDLESLNKSIRMGEAQGKPNHASLDLQVKKLEELSGLVDFESQISETGALELRIGGIKVLDENQSFQLRPEVDDVNKLFRIRLENGKTVNVSGGKLGADISMYEKEIEELKQDLDSITSAIVREFNTLHSSGFGLEDDAQRNFFNPDFTSAADIQINEEIRSNHKHIAASSTAGEAGNGDIAASIAAMRNEPLIGGRKLVDYAVQLISTPGSKISSLNAQIETRDSEIHMLETQQERESGVNIDEELSLMIKYQNAYQGAARVMQAAQQMYDTLISIAR